MKYEDLISSICGDQDGKVLEALRRITWMPFEKNRTGKDLEEQLDIIVGRIDTNHQTSCKIAVIITIIIAMTSQYFDHIQEEEGKIAICYVSYLKNLPYSDYLKTPHWSRVRSNCIRKYGHRCAICNAGNQILNVHHRTYENLGNERDCDVIALCKECHEGHHVREKGK